MSDSVRRGPEGMPSGPGPGTEASAIVAGLNARQQSEATHDHPTPDQEALPAFRQGQPHTTPAPAPHVDEPLVSVRDICVVYGTQSVVDHVSLDIRAGDFVGLVGPNGGGKTTLLRAMLGLAPLHCGEVRLFDTPLGRFRNHERLSYVPQHVVHVDKSFPATAFEVVLLGRAARRGIGRRYTKLDRQKAHDALEEVGVAHLANRPIGALSGGQRQRVFLAKALASDPELVILDEPMTGVDPKARERFYQLLHHLNLDHNLTILLVSHDTQAIALSAHRLVALNRSIVYDGRPEDFEAQGGFGATYDMNIHHPGGLSDA